MAAVTTEHRNREIDAWLAADPDETTRTELAALRSADPAAAAARFDRRLRFGTAGLRGPLGAGPDHMNRVVVRMAAWALGTRLLRDVAPGEERRVVIGHDARPGSREFAHDSGRVLAALGLEPLVADAVVATPVLAHAVLDQGAIAGVMVTASHNPPGDNGYKVYWRDGAQIVPPVDREIEGLIASRGPLTDDELAADDAFERPAAAVWIDRYLGAVVDRLPRAPSGPITPPVTVYTPMHGVGGATLLDAFARRGLPVPHVVEEQFAPDGAFPTVALPNPEEDGALDLARATAARVGADLILANDPDADRLGASVRAGHSWRDLTGDEIGTLLADHLLGLGHGPDRVVACSLVSATALDRVADHHGAAIRRTLTGFKWIIRPALDEPELDYVFGYEEALGYACSPLVRDKDGITAAVVLAELAGDLATRGADLVERLDEIARRDGLVSTRQVSIRHDGDRDAVAAVMTRLREHPPSSLGELPVVGVRDWADAVTPADVLELDLGADGRVLVRPSGTEPKIKAYVEMTAAVDDDVDAARRALTARLDGVADAVRELLTA